jgi:type I restriction enzyme M protein
MLLHGIEVPVQIRHDNTLNKPLSSWDEQLDVIVTNPPFGGTEEDGIEKNFPAEMQTRETADLFLQLIIEVLADKGRAAVVLPDGTLFGEGVKTKIKKLLTEECNLHTIVRCRTACLTRTPVSKPIFCSSPKASQPKRCGSTSTRTRTA